ncbi:MAG: beta-L-arabinofuranosidase domain-containing protein [Kiritimatiellia bacterium]
MKLKRFLPFAAVLGLAGLGGAAVPFRAPDAMETPALRDVRLKGPAADKMNAFIRARMCSAFARQEIFGEARRAFETRDDDIRGHGGLWRGEFWGKLMFGTARVADHLQDPALLAFVRAECHRLMKLQDKDGYLGSYADRELVAIDDPEATRRIYGWLPCWNLWNRKYAIWGMLMAYKATGDRDILVSVERQMDQWIGMLHRRGLKLYETGTSGMNGLPSMSILKPLLMLYAETGRQAYLDYAKEMLPDWDRADGACPNFFRNAARDQPLATWYPEPHHWGKCYEMMSCLDGLLEFHRVTGDGRALETVRLIRDNLARTEANPFGGVGFGDKFVGAARQLNALSEVCDAIHWIRLNLDLFEITGDGTYMDSVETAYFNNFLPGVFRRGDYGAFFIRGNCRHELQFQCGLAYNHCCVNNVPRSWMDVAEGAVTRDRDGVFHVNLYQDAEVTLAGAKIEISGGYPVGNVVTVKAPERAKLKFRQPGWCAKMDVARVAVGVYTVTFDMPARLVERDLPSAPAAPPTAGLALWMYNRYSDNKPREAGRDVLLHYRKTPAATLWRGPLLLAKAKRVGAAEAEIFAPETVNLKGYRPVLTALPDEAAKEMGVWGAWRLELAKPGAAPVRVNVCDFMSAGDDPLGQNANAFSIWF